MDFVYQSSHTGKQIDDFIDGKLNFTMNDKDLILKSTNLINNVPPENDYEIGDSSIYFDSSDGVHLGFINPRFDKEEQTQWVSLGARYRFNASSKIDNILRLGVTEDNKQVVYVSDSNAWKKALKLTPEEIVEDKVIESQDEHLLGSQIIIPNKDIVSFTQYGSMQPSSPGGETYYASSRREYSMSASFVSNNGIAQLLIKWTPSQDITIPADGNITDFTLGTLKEGKRPAIDCIGFSMGNQSVGVLRYRIKSNGEIQVVSGDASGEEKTIKAGGTTSLFLSAIYILHQ